jgi:hypothetical protein
VPFRHAPAVLIGQAFPDTICAEVSPCRLLAPPCFQSQAQLDAQLLFQLKDDRWKQAYVQTHNQVLLLQDSPHEDLRKKLDSWLLDVGIAYQHIKELLCAKVRQAETCSLQDLGFDTEERRTNHLLELQSQLEILESESPIDGIPCRGWLKLNIEDVKKGRAGLLDLWMNQDWAGRNGWDLESMHRERLAFRRWLEAYTGTEASIIDATSHPGPKRHGLAPPDLGEELECDPYFLEACALVRFRARFADSASTVVYLSNCEVREELTTRELAEVARLQSRPDTGFEMQAARSQRMLSQGIVVGTKKMTSDEAFLFNLLKAENPERPGWALSYREIGKMLNCSPTEVQRRRRALEGRLGGDFPGIIREARVKNEKGVNPATCGSGGKVNTQNLFLDAKAD